ncbi:MAG: DUF2382 domain-containing protein [Chloroflexi bacterium]|nr:DUF2382 domain-containing protein [Chloroflexota bacterium]MBV9131959.1 DUF2382 domain-containing protein [Chloroflexota bacterium]
MMQEREGEELRPGEERVVQLREEQLVAHKKLRDLGEIVIRTVVETMPAELQVEAQRDEVEIVHEPVGQAVSDRRGPWEEDGELIVPVYEEQLVVTKRLMLRERLRVRRVSTSERQLFQENVKRERLVIEDPQHTGRVREIAPTVTEHPENAEQHETEDAGFLTRLVSKALE